FQPAARCLSMAEATRPTSCAGGGVVSPGTASAHQLSSQYGWHSMEKPPWKSWPDQTKTLCLTPRLRGVVRLVKRILSGFLQQETCCRRLTGRSGTIQMGEDHSRLLGNRLPGKPCSVDGDLALLIGAVRGGSNNKGDHGHAEVTSWADVI